MHASRPKPQTMYDCKELLRQAIASNGPTCSLNHWDMSEMYDLTGLFSGSDFDGDIGLWEVSQVESMRSMFSKSAFTGRHGTLAHWNVAQVQTFSDMFYLSPFAADISPWTFSPYLDEQGFRTMFTNSTAPDIGSLVLPMQSHCSISDMFWGDNNTLNLWLLAQAQKNGWSRYHWDAILDGTASNLWASKEAMQYAKDAQPVLKALGMNSIQMAESLLQTWPTRQCLGEGLALPTLD